MNPRPLGYEPNELPDCSTPRHVDANYASNQLKIPRPCQPVKPPRGCGDAGALPGGRGDVADDEEPLAGLDEPEFASGDFLDSGRVLGQPSNLLPELCVRGARAVHLRRQLRVPLAGADQRERSAITGQPIEHGEPDEEGEREQETPVPARPTAGVQLTGGNSDSRGGHRATVVP